MRSNVVVVVVLLLEGREASAGAWRRANLTTTVGADTTDPVSYAGHQRFHQEVRS